jgi:transposase
VYSYYEKNHDKGKKFTADHFISEGVSKSTIYDIMKRFESGASVYDKKSSGRPPKIFTKRAKAKLKRLTNNKSGISQRKLASRFKCSQKLVLLALRDMSIYRWKKKKIPDRTDAQIKAARPKCSALYRKYGLLDWILDDESYFTFRHSSINGNDNYYSDDKTQTPADVKYKKKRKFEEKLLVWVALSTRGVSEPYIVKSGNAINQYVYRDECLMNRLVPFINQYHSDNNYIFWPDLATSHYAETVVDYMIENSIIHVDKDDNPANLPEARPIEDFWSILKGKVYEGCWEAKTLHQLELRIKKCLRELEAPTIQNLIESVKTRLDNIRRNDVLKKRFK